MSFAIPSGNSCVKSWYLACSDHLLPVGGLFGACGTLGLPLSLVMVNAFCCNLAMGARNFLVFCTSHVWRHCGVASIGMCGATRPTNPFDNLPLNLLSFFCFISFMSLESAQTMASEVWPSNSFFDVLHLT